MNAPYILRTRAPSQLLKYIQRDVRVVFMFAIHNFDYLSLRSLSPDKQEDLFSFDYIDCNPCCLV